MYLIVNFMHILEQPKPVKPIFTRKGPQIKPNRMKVVGEIPSNEELLAIKQKKRVSRLTVIACGLNCHS